MTSPDTAELSYEAWESLADARGWSDGLPLAVPTEKRVGEILDALAMDPDEMIGEVPPAGGLATAREVAVQCAMAGCRGWEAPIVVAALREMLEPDFLLSGVQGTTNPCAPLVIVSGPIARTPGFNYRHGVFGGGGRANLAIGRAVRLVLWNLGGARPGENDMSPLGHPAKLAFCVPENPDAGIWPPIHTDFGLESDVNAVTVFACTGPTPVTFSPNLDSILAILSESLPSTNFNAFHSAGQILVVLSQEPARMLARAGFTRSTFRRWLWDNARFEMGRLRRFGLLEDRVTYWRASGLTDDRPDLASLPDSAMLPMVKSPDDFLLLITGGDTQLWGGYCAGWGNYGGFARCREIQPTA